MKNNHKFKCKTTEELKLFGSQMNFSLRSVGGKTGSVSNRPHSAVYPSKSEKKTKGDRPKSAGSINRIDHSNFSQNIQWKSNLNQSKPDVTEFINSSAELLQNLLNSPNLITVATKTIPKNFQELNDKHLENQNKQLCKPKSVEDKILITQSIKGNHCEGYQAVKKSSSQMRKGNLEYLDSRPWLSEGKVVRFFENRPRSEPGRHANANHFYLFSCEHGYLSHKPHKHYCCRKKLEFRDFGTSQSVPKSESYLKTFDSVTPEKGNQEIINVKENFINEGQFVNEISDFENQQQSIKDGQEDEAITLHKDSSKIFPKDSSTVTIVYSSEEFTSNQSISSLENLNANEYQLRDKTEFIPEVKEKERKSLMVENTEEKDTDLKDNSSTYEEIVQLLATLEEEEDSGNLTEETKRDSGAESLSTLECADNLNVVYSYLEEIEKKDEFSCQKNSKSLCKTACDMDSPRLEELLNKSSVELAHEVFSLKIQIEDQKKGIKLLRETLAEMKEERRKAELDYQEALHKTSSDAEVLVQRHQKFIKQLLNEKKNLNETVSKLVEDLKSGEERHKRNMKAIEEKHQVEVKRAKDAQAVADKIKREKWIELKTQKIKEWTVKGLEPELSRMAARQQEELTELRNLHRAELEAVELRAARRTSELMDELRAELTKEKEHAIAKETAAVRANMERQFEEERSKMERQKQVLKDRLRKEEVKLNEQEIEFHQRLLESKKEAEKETQKIIQGHQEKLEEVRRKHSIETKNLKESLEAEKEIWMSNYKKQQVNKMLEKEAELHQQYKRERDRDIEMIIETLEKESTQMQTELNQAAENKLKRLKEKLDAEIKELEASESTLKNKLSEAKTQLLEKDERFSELNAQIRQLQTETVFLRKKCEEMSSERAALKEIIRKEFEEKLKEKSKENENIGKEIAALKEQHSKELAKKDQVNALTKNEMQKELTKVYTRIKMTVNKKDKIIESLREEIRAGNQRCEQLEMMLDNQRRNLLLH